MGCGQQMCTATIEGDEWMVGGWRWETEMVGWLEVVFCLRKPSAKKGNINSRHSMSNRFTYIWLISMVNVGR